MILIHRGDEPQELTVARSTHLPRLRAIAAVGPPTHKQITGYDPVAVRDALRSAQHEKCCYCEKSLDIGDPLDHYRPKTMVSRLPGSKLTPGYWWLAHSWLNLLYACHGCNTAKGMQFPLETGSTPLGQDEEPPGGEVPLLIDPASTNGMLHIRFELLHVDVRKRQWIPRPLTDFGKTTIEVCKLDRGSLLGEYARHVTQGVMQYVDNVKAALLGGNSNSRGVQSAVYMAKRALLNPGQRFIGLSYDALQYFIPDTRLTPHDLSWNRPA